MLRRPRRLYFLRSALFALLSPSGYTLSDPLEAELMESIRKALRCCDTRPPRIHNGKNDGVHFEKFVTSALITRILTRRLAFRIPSMTLPLNVTGQDADKSALLLVSSRIGGIRQSGSGEFNWNNIRSCASRAPARTIRYQISLFCVVRRSAPCLFRFSVKRCSTAVIRRGTEDYFPFTLRSDWPT